MEYAKKLEVLFAGWYRQLPFHLPAGGRKWLSENVWWLVLIGVIASILSVIGSIRAYMWAQDISRHYSDVAAYYGVAPVASNSMDMVAIWLSVIFYLIVIVLEAMAISPLKAGKKRGWNLLFGAMLVSALSGVISAVISVSFGGLIGAAIGFAIGGFFLFEIHDNFSVVRSTKTTEPAPAAAKKTK